MNITSTYQQDCWQELAHINSKFFDSSYIDVSSNRFYCVSEHSLHEIVLYQVMRHEIPPSYPIQNYSRMLLSFDILT